MRWFKKIVRAVLALLPLYAIFLIPSNVSALQHDYKGYVVSDIPIPVLDSNNYVDFTSGDSNAMYSNNLSVTFDNAYKPDLNTIRPYSFLSYSTSFVNSNGICKLDSAFDGNVYFSTGLWFMDRSDYLQIGVTTGPTFSKNYQFSSSSVNRCFLSSTFSSSNPVTFVDGPDAHLKVADADLNNSVHYLDDSSSKSYFNQHISPYPYQSDGLTLHDTSVSSNTGFTYSNSFNFGRLWTGSTVTKFRLLSIPLFTNDGYFLEYSNLYQGRSLEWRFLFNFPGSFSWNSDLSQGEIAIYVTGYDTSRVSYNFHKLSDCISNLITVDGATQLEISCPTTLDHNYSYILPYLRIYNPGYVWDSDTDFDFYSTYLITDNDSTPGASFNGDFYGKMWSSTNGVGGDGGCGPNDFFCNLNNIFNFSIPINNTPIGGILGNFSDQSSCASIPTIAGMIHSNETQICPWFSSSVRSIATPVLSLFSACFVFGFVVRWLKSSSGDNMLNSHKNGDKD